MEVIEPGGSKRQASGRLAQFDSSVGKEKED